MGSVSLKIGDGTARFRRATLCSSALHIVMLASVVFTNLFALFAFTRPIPQPPPAGDLVPLELHQHHRLISDQVDLILREINSSQRHLSQIERDLLGYDTFDPTRPGTPPELQLFLARHPLPLGRDSRTGITEMLSSIGHSCAASRDLLAKYATYTRGEPCPAAAAADGSGLADNLLARGCEPLPRRRCLSHPALKPGLLPFPESLWAPVSDKISGAWNAAFDKLMWVKSKGKTDFLIDDVLALAAGSGEIRVGLDIAGGVGNFAARMADKDVTVVTSTLNTGGKPVSEVVAARGLFPLHLTTGQRFPFYDSVFDLVHTMTGLNDGAAATADWQERLEFLLFDIDRILRPGGLLWLDNYRCLDDKHKSVLTTLIEKFRYKKLKWVVGEKADAAGAGKPKAYLSAVLQKPARV